MKEKSIKHFTTSVEKLSPNNSVKKTWEKPFLTVLGNLREIVQNNQGATLYDQTYGPERRKGTGP
ncbi:MAG: hypothetical protein JW757_09795 [Anaerolineales bacterium]|nr:hypothetical protein [Anaerolineales bacterium]